MNPDQYFSTRRTVRAYDLSRPVPAALLRTIAEKAMRAPNTGNMQLYSVVATTDPEGIAALAPCHFSQPAAKGAGALLTFCLDLNRYDRWCRMGGAVPGMGNLQGFTWGVMDTAIFAQQFCTIAEMEGLGTCYLGTTTYNAPEISRLLHLPEGVVPVITLAVGWPAEEPELTERLPVDCIFHEGAYRTLSDAELSDAYAEKENREDSRRFVAENAKRNLAQVFAEVRYPRAANEQFSAVYRDFLRARGIEL